MRFSLVFTHAMPQAALDGIPALARLKSYGRADDIDDADAAVSELLGYAGSPVAPLAALGAGLDARGAYVLRADPVTFVAGRDDVLIAGRVDDLGADDATALMATLNRHFAEDGVAFHAPRADAWFVTATAHVPVDTGPLRPNEPIGAHLPRGAHGATWRRWLSEMQMLLHEHAVNERREALGLAPVTGIWISDGGTLPATPSPPAMALHASPSRVGDVAIGIARLCQAPIESVPAAFDAIARSRDALVALPHAADTGALQRDWLAPAVAALERGTLDHLAIVAANARARRFTASRPSWWRRLRTRA